MHHMHSRLSHPALQKLRAPAVPPASLKAYTIPEFSSAMQTRKVGSSTQNAPRTYLPKLKAKIRCSFSLLSSPSRSSWHGSLRASSELSYSFELVIGPSSHSHKGLLQQLTTTCAHCIFAASWQGLGLELFVSGHCSAFQAFGEDCSKRKVIIPARKMCTKVRSLERGRERERLGGRETRLLLSFFWPPLVLRLPACKMPRHQSGELPTQHIMTIPWRSGSWTGPRSQLLLLYKDFSLCVCHSH